VSLDEAQRQICWLASIESPTKTTTPQSPLFAVVLSADARDLVRSPAGSSPPLQLEAQGDIAGGPGPGDTFGRAPRRTPMSLGPGAELYQD